VISERIDCHAPDLRIFTSRNIPRNKTLDFIPHRGIDRSLASNRGLTSGFGPTSSQFQVSTMPAFDASHLGDAFTPGQRTTELSLQSFDR